jgi:cytochrome c-type biogenesis protein CcmE
MPVAKKRQLRLVAALTAAVLLAVALIYTSFTAANESVQPSELRSGMGSVTLNGEVVKGTAEDAREGVRRFSLIDVDGGSERVPVVYEGSVPDAFREAREVLVTGQLNADGVFVGEKDSLITKCPSKFKEQYGDDPRVQYEDG